MCNSKRYASRPIIEAPSIFLPVVNVGTRQRDRVSAGNVIYVDYNSRLVHEAIIKSVTDLDYRANLKTLKNPYGDGASANKIANTLSEIKINDQLIYKNITYKLSNIY